MQGSLENEDLAVAYTDKFREYGIRYLDDMLSVQTITHCPWCGTKFPASLRAEWFDELDHRSLNPEDDLPEELTTGQWWRTRGL